MALADNGADGAIPGQGMGGNNFSSGRLPSIKSDFKLGLFPFPAPPKQNT
jgi:hypothetical protein